MNTNETRKRQTLKMRKKSFGINVHSRIYFLVELFYTWKNSSKVLIPSCQHEEEEERKKR